jgi:ribosomal protein L7/L12
MEIRSAKNGFIVTLHDMEYVTKTLMEAAELVGEAIPRADDNYLTYAVGYNADDLADVKALAARGEKISAIKKLRACFGPAPARLGLREAKDIVEHLC